MNKARSYIVILILIFIIQACNQNAPSSESTTTDSTFSDSAKDRVMQENATKDSTEKKNNSVRVAATDVPVAVNTAFKTRYPDATNVKWTKAIKKGSTLFYAKWQVNGKKIKAAFSENGNFIKEKEPK